MCLKKIQTVLNLSVIRGEVWHSSKHQEAIISMVFRLFEIIIHAYRIISHV